MNVTWSSMCQSAHSLRVATCFTDALMIVNAVIPVIGSDADFIFLLPQTGVWYNRVVLFYNVPIALPYWLC